MALPTIAVINTAVDSIYAAAAEDKTRRGGRRIVSELSGMYDWLKRRYAPVVDVTLTDATDAGVAEAIASDGELGLAFAAVAGTGQSFPVGAVFQVGGTEDFTDDALATAKGGAVADGDLFQVSGADAVTYLGAAGDIDFADEEPTDFVDL